MASALALFPCVSTGPVRRKGRADVGSQVKGWEPCSVVGEAWAHPGRLNAWGRNVIGSVALGGLLSLSVSSPVT